jgi:hypothetical protein
MIQQYESFNLGWDIEHRVQYRVSDTLIRFRLLTHSDRLFSVPQHRIPIMLLQTFPHILHRSWRPVYQTLNNVGPPVAQCVVPVVYRAIFFDGEG